MGWQLAGHVGSFYEVLALQTGQEGQPMRHISVGVITGAIGTMCESGMLVA